MSRTDKIQQLEQRLAEFEGMPAAELRLKIDTLNELAWQLSDTDPKRAEALSQAAFALAESADGESEPYLAGKAYSLRTEKIGGLVKLETAIGQGTMIRLHYDGI